MTYRGSFLGAVKVLALFRKTIGLFFCAPSCCVLAMMLISNPVVAASSPPPYPVIFVHGLNSSGATWKAMIEYLDDGYSRIGGRLRATSPSESGVTACSMFSSFSTQPTSEADWAPLASAPSLVGKWYFAIDFSDPSDLSFDEQGRELKSVIDCVKAVTGLTKVILVGHSMGGIASRHYLQSLMIGRAYGNDVDRLITVGTPHAGSRKLSDGCKGAAWDWRTYAVGWINKFRGQECAHIAIQQLLPSSPAIALLNTSNVSQRMPSIRTISIVGRAGAGWAPHDYAYHAGSDGIVPEESQSLAHSVPYPLNDHQTMTVDVANCGESIAHTCETRDLRVMLRVYGAIFDPVDPYRAAVETLDYSNLTPTEVTVGALVENEGFTSFTPFVQWGTSPTAYSGIRYGDVVAAQGRWLYAPRLTGLPSGQIVYYRVAIETSTGITISGPQKSVQLPISIPTYLPAPAQSLPIANATGQQVRPYLNWSAVPGATSYRVVVARSASAIPVDPSVADCAMCVANIVSKESVVRIPGDVLTGNATYYWSVKARSPDRYGMWSPPRRFDTVANANLPAPAPMSPLSGSTAATATPVVSWSPVAGATSYRLMIADDASKLPTDPLEGACPSCVVNATVPATSYLVPPGFLALPGSYVLQIKARNAQQVGAWSQRIAFSTHDPANSVPPQLFDIAASSNGNGTVTGGGWFVAGAQVTIGATPDASYSFAGWYENGVEISRAPVLTLQADRNRNFAATFVSSLQNSLLALTASPPQCGTTTGGGWVPFPPPGSGVLYPADISATANPGCAFLGWYEDGNLVSLQSAITIYPTALNRQLTAVFGVALSNNPRLPSRVSGGLYGTLGLGHDGSVYAWGPNYGGGMLLSPPGILSRPVKPEFLDLIPGKAGVAGSGGGAFILGSKGELFAFGANTNGVLNGGSGYITPAALVAGTVSDVASSYFATLAVKSDGSVWMWGTNHLNQVNTTDAMGVLPPQVVPGLVDMVGVAIGIWCNVALKRDGTVWTWGGGNNSANGCLGDGSTDVRRQLNGTPDFTPHQIPTLSQIVQVSCGDETCLALRKDGAVFAWGYNQRGQVGDGSTTTRFAPVQISLPSAAFVLAKGANSAALTTSGRVYTWGKFDNGRLGYPASADVTVPTLVPGIADIVEISSDDGGRMVAMDRTGALWTWGFNSDGSLAIGTTTHTSTPTRVLCPDGMSGNLSLQSDGCRYVVTPTIGLNGVVFPEGIQEVARGGTISFTVTPVQGFHPEVGGTCGGTLVGAQFTTAAVTASCTVIISFIADATAHRRGDTHGDGKADLFWRTAAPGTGLSWWMMNGAVATAANYHDVDPAWQIADVGDLDGDGKADLVWRRASDGATYLWLLDGFSFKGFADLGVLDPAAWNLVGTADLNGDGKDDVVWRGVDGTVYAWLMNGGTIASQGVISNPGAQWLIADLADMDGDGKADIVFRNSVDGGIYIYFMNGLAIASGGYVGAVDPAAWTLVGAADFSGEGNADFLWRHTSGDTWVWLMNGAVFQSAGGIGNPGTSWSVRSFGDFDGDGKADLVWRHTDGTTYLWKMNGASVTSYLPVANPGGSWQVVAP